MPSGASRSRKQKSDSYEHFEFQEGHWEMKTRKYLAALVACGLAVLIPALVWAEDVLGTVKSVDVRGR